MRRTSIMRNPIDIHSMDGMMNKMNESIMEFLTLVAIVVLMITIILMGV